MIVTWSVATLLLNAQKQPFVLSLYGDQTPPLALKLDVPEITDTADQDIVLVRNITRPELTVYLPAVRNAERRCPLVLICPGGGYYIVAIDHEGYAVARLLAANGVAAAVLKYRLPDPALVSEPHKVPLMDVQAALSLLHERSAEWQVDPDRIGIMGFSAGGHLAGTALTEPVTNHSLRPDFGILVYPVVSFTATYAHLGSRDRLLGALKETLAGSYSLEHRINEDTPPIILIHAQDDQGVPVSNSLALFEKLQAKHVPASLHIVSSGGHGFGLGTHLPEARHWPDTMLDWLASVKFK